MKQCILLTSLLTLTLSLFVGCDDDETTNNEGGTSAGETQAGEETAGETSAGAETAGEASAGAETAGEAPAGEEIAGEAPAGEETAGETPAGEEIAGEMPAGEETAGEAPAGEMPAGEPYTGETVTGTFIITDYLLGSGIADSTLTANGLSAQTDEEGIAELEVPESSVVELKINAESYYPYNIFLHTCAEGCTKYESDGSFRYRQPLVSLAGGMILGDLFNLEINENDTGIVISAVFLETEEGLSILSGAKVELDTPPAVTVVEDSNDALGLLEGTEIATGGLIFVNVETGTRTLTLTVPEGYGDCSVNPGDAPMTEATVTVYPREISVLDFICKPIP